MADEGEEELLVEEKKERELIDKYVKDNGFENVLNELINKIVQQRPDDPYTILGELIKKESKYFKTILYLEAKEIVYIKGNIPTLRISITTTKGVFQRVSPSNMFPEQLYDSDFPNRFQGKGIKTLASRLTSDLNNKLKGLSPLDQVTFDKILSSTYLETYGKNITMSISVALCKAGAKGASIPVYEYIASNIMQMPLDNMCIPLPHISLINGGKFADNDLFIQDILFTVLNANSLTEVLEISSQITYLLKEELKKQGIGNLNYGENGGYAVSISDFSKIFNILNNVFDKAKEIYPSSEMVLGIDFDANNIAEISTGDGEELSFSYNTEKVNPTEKSGSKKNGDEIYGIFKQWKSLFNYGIGSVFAPFHTSDNKMNNMFTWQENIKAEINEETADTANRAVIGSDDSCYLQTIYELTTSNEQEIRSLHDQSLSNTWLVNLSNFSTLTEFALAVKAAKQERIPLVLSCAAGESDSFLADIAIGCGITQVKFGGFNSMESVSQYGYLMETETENVSNLKYVTNEFRR